MPRIECPSCGHKLKYAEEYAGRKAKCTRCATSLRLPAAMEPQPLPLPQPEPQLHPLPQAVPKLQPMPLLAHAPAAEPPKNPAALPVRPRPEIKRTVHVSPAGAKFAEGGTVLSCLHGTFSSERLGCHYVLSPDGRRVFHTGGQQKGGFIGMLDAMTVKQVNSMLDGTAFEPEGFAGAYGFQFSGDSQHIAYFTADKNRRRTLCIDGGPVGKAYAETSRPVLNTDASAWAFAAKIDGEWHIVHNARVGPEFDSIDPDSLSISADGQLVGYLGVRAKRKIAVLGDREFPLDDLTAGAVNTAGALRNVRMDKTKLGRCVVLDGEAGPDFEKIDAASLRSSPDGARFAYSAKKGGKWHLVLDGVVGPAFAEIASDSPTFSPDGRRFAYAACAEKSWVTGKADWRIVLDGSNGPTYASVGGLAFSPDGTRFGHAAQTKKGTALVVEGVEMGYWEGVSALIFSPDSRRHIAIATVGRRTMKSLVIDGKEGPHYKDVGQIAFTPDSRHVVALAFGAKRSEERPSFWENPGTRDGGFLLLDNDYEAKGWIRSSPASRGNQSFHTEVRIGFAGPSAVYAVSMLASGHEISFSRVEVECL